MSNEHSKVISASPLVIVVDDDAAVCGSLKFALEIEGFRVHAFSSGEQMMGDSGLAECACFIIDQKLAGATGLDVIAGLRRQRIPAPAILITSNPTLVLRDRAAKAGVAIVEKPLLGNTLIERVRDAVAHRPAAH